MTDEESRRVDRPLTADGYRTLIKAAVEKDRRTRQHALDQLSRHEIEVVAWTLARMVVEIYRSTGSDNEHIITGAEGGLAKILHLKFGEASTGSPWPGVTTLPCLSHRPAAVTQTFVNSRVR